MSIRFEPLSKLEGDPVLPGIVRHVTSHEGARQASACVIIVTEPVHYRLIADLLYANSDQWTILPKVRRGNPGLLRGTVWFYALALKQTVRGLVYLATRGKA